MLLKCCVNMRVCCAISQSISFPFILLLLSFPCNSFRPSKIKSEKNSHSRQSSSEFLLHLGLSSSPRSIVGAHFKLSFGTISFKKFLRKFESRSSMSKKILFGHLKYFWVNFNGSSDIGTHVAQCQFIKYSKRMAKCLKGQFQLIYV